MEFLKYTYKPFLFARYSMFLKSNKKNNQKFPLDEEYGMLSFFNIMTPLWIELTLILILSRVFMISYNGRLILIGLFVIINVIISKIIIRNLKKEEYITAVINEFNNIERTSSKFSNLFFCVLLLAGYSFLPFLPIVLFFIL